MFGGLGDHLFALPALEEFHRRAGYPCFDVFCCHMPELLRDMPYFAAVHTVPCRDLVPEWAGGTNRYKMIPCLTVGEGSGIDCGENVPPNYAFKLLEVDDMPYSQRRIMIHLRGQDRENAYSIAKELGWAGQPIVCVQMGGAMKSKHYSHLWRLLCRLSEHGYFAVWHEVGQLTAFDYRRTNNLVTRRLPSIRMLASLQSISFCHFGFDSGPSYLASAVECPSVILSGFTDINGILGHLEGMRWVHQIRRNWPYKCARQHGLSCRSFAGADSAGGVEFCPVRGRWFGEATPDKLGCDCMDIVSVDEIIGTIEYAGNAKLNERYSV